MPFSRPSEIMIIPPKACWFHCDFVISSLAVGAVSKWKCFLFYSELESFAGHFFLSIFAGVCMIVQHFSWLDWHHHTWLEEERIERALSTNGLLWAKMRRRRNVLQLHGQWNSDMLPNRRVTWKVMRSKKCIAQCHNLIGKFIVVRI